MRHIVNKQETPLYMLSPISGIYISIIESGKQAVLKEFILNADGFEVRLMESFMKTFKIEKLKENDKKRYSILEKALSEIMKECASKKVGLKPAFTSNKKELEEMNKAPENCQECPICYLRNVDTRMLPCKHLICGICYDMSMRIRYTNK